MSPTVVVTVAGSRFAWLWKLKSHFLFIGLLPCGFLQSTDYWALCCTTAGCADTPRRLPVWKEEIVEKERIADPKGYRQISRKSQFLFQKRCLPIEQTSVGKGEPLGIFRGKFLLYQDVWGPWRKHLYLDSGKESDIKDGLRSQVTITGQHLMGQENHREGKNFA